jgi:excisionase family DNA binding protein
MSGARFVSSAVACQLLDVHPNTIRRWVKAGLLPRTRRTAGGHRRYLLDDLRNALAGVS